MLARVQRLEQARASPWDRLIGPIEVFEAEIYEGITLGKFDPTDMPEVLASVRRWVREC